MQLKKADPFKKSQLASLKKKLEDWAISNEIEIETQNLVLKRRKQKMVAKTFYECGIVVPVNKKTKVGYRKIPETDGTFLFYYSMCVFFHLIIFHLHIS